MSDHAPTAADVSEALRLVGSLTAVPLGLVERKRQALAELRRLTDADVSVWIVQRRDETGAGPSYYTVVDGGWRDDAQRRHWLESLFSSESREVFGLARPEAAAATYSRKMLLDDETWYRSAFYLKYREPEGLDDFLYALFGLGAGVESVIRLHRASGRPAFGARERWILQSVAEALEPLHRASAPPEGFPSVHELSPRERQVLLLLLSGESRKSIAQELGLSAHTVADYTKRLHRYFEVHSRAELLSRFIPGILTFFLLVPLF